VGCAERAIAADAPEGVLSGLVIQKAASRVYDVFRPRGTIGLATLLNWVYLERIRYLSTVSVYTAFARRRRRVAKASAHLPLTEADTIATGERIRSSNRSLVVQIPTMRSGSRLTIRAPSEASTSRSIYWADGMTSFSTHSSTTTPASFGPERSPISQSAPGLINRRMLFERGLHRKYSMIPTIHLRS
jgi:hypothetical protein